MPIYLSVRHAVDLHYFKFNISANPANSRLPEIFNSI